mmetsp:Transcript_26778/g.52231  ORF Transcript_26778/g.52231 Transcript_26778/m.52231 type:complete len:203 (-) Transcript_26778:135-743(-)
MSLMHQETWVRFGTNGIGLSDHQNRYSDGCRVGNWVENEYGHQQQATMMPPSFQGVSTAMHDFTKPVVDEAVSRQTKIGNVSNIDMAHGPDETHDQTHLTTTYNLAMCHADGPRRVDTMLWSGITKVDKSVPTQVASQMSLLEKKKAMWAKDREDTWKTAYGQQFHDVCAESRQVNGKPMTKEPSLSKLPRTHIQCGFRENY